jgi:hypothetical protein
VSRARLKRSAGSEGLPCRVCEQPVNTIRVKCDGCGDKVGPCCRVPNPLMSPGAQLYLCTKCKPKVTA